MSRTLLLKLCTISLARVSILKGEEFCWSLDIIASIKMPGRLSVDSRKEQGQYVSGRFPFPRGIVDSALYCNHGHATMVLSESRFVGVLMVEQKEARSGCPKPSSVIIRLIAQPTFQCHQATGESLCCVRSTWPPCEVTKRT